MPESRRAAWAPWITAGIAGVVFIVLLLVYYQRLIPDRDNFTPGQLTSSEQQAMSAAATETVNVVSYSRAHFAADFARALKGTTGGLRKDVMSKKAATLKSLTQGKYDLSAKVTNMALVGPADNGGGYVVLLTINGFQSTSPNNPILSNLEVTVVRKGGKYLASNLTSVGVQ